MDIYRQVIVFLLSGATLTVFGQELNSSDNGQRLANQLPEQQTREPASQETESGEAESREAAPREAAPREAAPREAAPREAAPREAETRNSEPLGRHGRDSLRPYEANYFVLADSTMQGELEDEPHGEFYLSLKYSVLDQAFGDSRFLPDRLSFVYNGLYDFYMLESDRYQSAPVLSRRQNPGLVFEYDLDIEQGKVTEWFYINWFHESNGQTIDFADVDANSNGIDDGVDEFNRQLAIGGKEFALAKVSRGWDYGEFIYGRGVSGENDAAKPGWWRWQANIRLYCDCQAAGIHAGREDRIFWESVKEQPVIGDYDGLRFLWEHTVESVVSHPMLYRIEYKTGVKKDSAFENNSARLTLNFALDKAWLSLFYFNGYGKEVATYHLRTNYFGIGFEFR